MRSIAALVLLPLLLALAAPANAQKTTEPQQMAKPGESTEPPHPRAAPVPMVVQHDLPRAGGILIFGGTGGTGLELVKTLVATHEHVTVVAADDDAGQAAAAAGATVAKSNLTDPAALKTVFTSAPFRAVVSTLAEAHDAPSLDYAANKAVGAAAKDAGVPRFVMLSAVGAGDSVDALPWYARMTDKIFGRDDFANVTKAEDDLRTLDLELSVIRAGGIANGPSQGKVQLAADPHLYSQITRADLASLIAAVIDDTTTNGKTLTAYDPARVGFLAAFGWTNS
jgi:uncharacterized protein YbjT (DUF2867 family)